MVMFSKLGDTEPLTSIESSLRPLNNDISSGLIDNSSWFLQLVSVDVQVKSFGLGFENTNQRAIDEI